MALNVSNETKVGALTAISITLLILGFNFLKGNNPLKKSQYFYATFQSIDGLVASNPVVCNGLVIGSVYETEPADEYLSAVTVTIRLTQPVRLPANSKAIIKGNLLSTPVIEIIKGNATQFLQKGDTIQTEASSGFLGEVLEQLGPTQSKLNSALGGMDTLLMSANDVMNPATREQLRLTIAHLNTVSSNLIQTTQAINKLMDAQEGNLNATMDNLRATSLQLKNGTEKLPAITANFEKVSKDLTEAEFKQLIGNLNNTAAQLQAALQKMNSDQNSVGALLNDRKMYDNLASTTNSLNLLLQDLRLHPKRYVNVSVFGKKDKSQPLMRPMHEDSTTQEQFLPPKQ